MATVRLHHETTSNKVTLQFSHHGKVARYSLPVKIPHANWNNITQRVVGHPCAVHFNSVLTSTLARAQTLLLNYCTENPTRHLTAVQLKDEVCAHLFGNSETPLTFAQILDEFAATHTGRSREFYTTTRRACMLSDRQFESRSIEEINNAWLQRFRISCSAHGNCTNTINIRLRCIRAVFNYARKMEYTTLYPFVHEKIKNTDIIRHDLTNEQIITLMTAPVPPELSLSVTACRLIFYLIGINCKDFYGLSADNIRNGRVEYIRAKTHKVYSIEVQPEAHEILTNTSAYLQPRAYRSHRDYLKRLNRDLAAFCKAVDIPVITTNWLRHSWATFAWRIGIPIDTISLALGHSFGLSVTNGYIQKNLSAADKANRLVLDTIKAATKPPLLLE